MGLCGVKVTAQNIASILSGQYDFSRAGVLDLVQISSIESQQKPPTEVTAQEMTRIHIGIPFDLCAPSRAGFQSAQNASQAPLSQRETQNYLFRGQRFPDRKKFRRIELETSKFCQTG